ncbi:MAG: hypothetical protein KJ904_18440 [Alphaproteobacteria bacterium]|nr:hypothetical protein [Alphaproteobacteria bacterium]MBU0798283.1 hypothetical protein [Alphaproteobacteria bacterium]MBU0889139.1 hypothetical protein [Alphaproteobacteria bacterium]MBU1812173.1 hypothetical protein [Alphaproteobacteria bacterium]MBU2090959.1 hypothetical protein [Alphaproteobacteria bacterium]
MMKLTRILAFCCAVAVAAPLTLSGGEAAAQQPKPLGTFSAWSAFTYQEDGGLVCYVVSEPIKDDGDYTRRGKIYTLVTHRPAKKTTGVVSVVAGYQYADGGEALVSIGSSNYKLFTVDDHAWAATAADDKSIVDAMKKGANMVIKGKSSRNTSTTDTYSLNGFTRAYEEISKACKVAG